MKFLIIPKGQISLSSAEVFRLILLSFILGVFGQFFLVFEGYGYIVFLFLLLCLWRRSWWCFSFFSFGLGILYAQNYREDIFLTQNPLFIGNDIVVTGVVKNFPEKRKNGQRFFLYSETVVFNGQRKNFRENFLVISSDDSMIRYGDTVIVKGDISQPRKYKDFDYASYLYKYKIRSIIKTKNKLEVIQKSRGFLSLSQEVRHFFANSLQVYLPKPHSDVSLGMLVGIRSPLEKQLDSDFRSSGLVHLLVVSGFNVALVAWLVFFIFRRFGKMINFLVTGGVLLFFVGITGFDPPVVRALIMAIVGASAGVFHRQSDIRNVFLITIVIIALINPLTIQSDVSFFLSFMATSGIIFLAPVMRKKLRYIPEKFNLRDIFAIIFSAQIAVMPILILYFETFPWIGFISNAFAEPLVPGIMIFSFFVVLVGVISDFFAKILSAALFMFLELLLRIAQFFGQFPGVQIPQFFSVFVLCGLLLFFTFAIFSRKFSHQFLYPSKEKKEKI